MKKVLALVLAALLAVSLFACGDEPSKDNPEATAAESGTKSSGFKAEDIYFEANGKKVTINVKQSEFIAAMAAAGFTEYTTDEAASCMFSGNGFDVTTYFGEDFTSFSFPPEACEPDNNTVDEIFVATDKVTFKGGIKVGATKEEVIAAFGEGYFMNGDDCMTYNESGDAEKVNSEPKLAFYFEDGKVAGIDLVANLYHVIG